MSNDEVKDEVIEKIDPNPDDINDGIKKETPDDTKSQEDEIIVTIGDEDPEEKEPLPEWVREMRKSNKALNKEIRQLRRDHEQPATVVGKKPAMADSDIDYDEEKYEAALSDYYERKRKSDDSEEKIKSEQKASAVEWQGTLDRYNESKDELKIPDFDYAEEVVTSTLSEIQQGIVLTGATKPALVVAALGRNPAKAKELAGITDHIKFAFAVAKLEETLTIKKRTPSTKPESKSVGTAPVSGSTDTTLDRLEKEAEKTGDRSQIIAHKRKIKQQA